MSKPNGERDALNLLFIIADQLRADALSGQFAPFVPTPNLDKLAEASLCLTQHHTVAVPCGPARASLFTGLYPSEHGAIRNGVPLKPGLTNIALELRRIGREPLLFGYTDTQPDPTTLAARDPARTSSTGPMTGFTEVVEMREEAWRWLYHLRACGYDVPDAGAEDFDRIYRPEGGTLGGPALYDAAHSDTAYLTDETIKALDIRKTQSWSAFVTYIRPHPPYVAPAPYHDIVDPARMPPAQQGYADHPFVQAQLEHTCNAGVFWGYGGNALSVDQATVAKVRATYLGLVAELDAQIGRLLDWLEATGQRENTLIIFTSDHGDMLGDYGLWGKLSPFAQASHVPFFVNGPEISSDKIADVTQSTDVMGAVLEYLSGGQMAFEGTGNSATARVEFSLSHPRKPTPFMRAGLVTTETGGCTVHHDGQSRVAVFDGDLPDLTLPVAEAGR